MRQWRKGPTRRDAGQAFIVSAGNEMFGRKRNKPSRSRGSGRGKEKGRGHKERGKESMDEKGRGSKHDNTKMHTSSKSDACNRCGDSGYKWLNIQTRLAVCTEERAIPLKYQVVLSRSLRAKRLMMRLSVAKRRRPSSAKDQPSY